MAGSPNGEYSATESAGEAIIMPRWMANNNCENSSKLPANYTSQQGSVD